MSTLIHLLRKEFKQIFRDPAILRIIFIVPAVQLLILPFAADYEIKNVNIAIVDHDHSAYSRQLVRKIENSNYFMLVGYSNSYQEAIGWIEKEEADLLVEIPAGFEKDLVRESEATLLMAVNAVNGTKGNLGASYAMGIIREFNQWVRTEWVVWPRVNPVPLVELRYSHRFNEHMNYQRFMVPGILAILLTMVGGFLNALNIVREKEIGTIEQLNVSPIRKHHFILGKLIPFWLLGLVVLTIGLGITFFVHNIHPRGSLLTLYGFSAVYLLAVLGFGLLISTYADTQQQAMLIAFFFILIFILMSGLFTPIESMPEWAQWIAYFNPVTYMVEVMRMILLKGSVLSDITRHLAVVAVMAAVLNSWAIWNYQKTN